MLTFENARARLVAAFLLLALVGVLFALRTHPTHAASACVSAASGNWSATTTWSNCGGGVPGAADSVTVASGHEVTVDADSAAASLVVNNGASAASLSVASSTTLNVSGAVTINNPTTAATTTLAVGAGNLTAGSIALLSAGTHKVSQLTIDSGQVTVAGDVTLTGTVARVVFTGAGKLAVAGNFGGDGMLFSNGLGAIDLDGSAAQTLGAYTTYNDVVIDNTGGGVTTSAATTIGGTLLVAHGTFDLGDEKVTVAGATTIEGTLRVSGTTGAKTFGDIVIADGGDMDFTAPEAIGVSGDLEVDGAGVITGSSGTWTFKKAGGGTVRGSAAAVTIPGNAFFTSDYRLRVPFAAQALAASGATVTNAVSATVAGTLSGAGVFVQGAGAALTLEGSTTVATLDATSTGNIVQYASTTSPQTLKSATYYDLSIDKGVETTRAVGTTTILHALTVASGTLNLAGSTIVFGGSDDSIAASAPITFAAVALAGTHLTSLVDLTVTGTLALADGLLDMGAHTVTARGAVTRTTGYVIGSLEKPITTSGAMTTFEVGDAAHYAPVTITSGTTTAPGALIVSTTSGTHPSIGSASIDPAKSVERYWSIANQGAGLDTYDAVFDFDPSDVAAGADPSAFIAGLFNGSWSYPTLGVQTPTSLEIADVTGFGDVAIGDAPSSAPPPTPLPPGVSGGTRSSGSSVVQTILNALAAPTRSPVAAVTVSQPPIPAATTPVLTQGSESHARIPVTTLGDERAGALFDVVIAPDTPAPSPAGFWWLIPLFLLFLGAVYLAWHVIAGALLRRRRYVAAAAFLVGLLLSPHAQAQQSALESAGVTRVAPGGTLPVAVKLTNFGSARRVDVEITYKILGSSGTVLESEEDTVAVDTTASFVQQLSIPPGTPPGSYRAESDIQYPGQAAPATSSFPFTVEAAFFGIFESDLILYGSLTLVLAASAAVLARFWKRARSRRPLLHDYSDKPKDERIYYEIVSDTIGQMRQRAGDRALEIALGIKGLRIDEKTGKVLALTGSPSKVVADLVSGYETDLGKKVSFALRNGG